MIWGAIAAIGQPIYTQQSVLASGLWGKIGVVKEGIYRVDVNMLATLGLTSSSISSASIRLYGNGGKMLPENNVTSRIDDLAENSIEIFDGGDGIFNGTDYFIFYAAGSHQWNFDTINQNFGFQRNLYSDTAYYFITINTNSPGKRIITQPLDTRIPQQQINTYTDRYAYESDLSNLLNSGKEWVGENFLTNFGGTTTRNFSLNWNGLITSEPLTIATSLTGRSVGNSAQFNVALNNRNIQTVNIPTVSGDLLGAFARNIKTTGNYFSNQSNLTLNITYQSNAAGAEGWLNQFTITGRRSLSFTDNTFLSFRDIRTLQPNIAAQFNVSNAPTASSVWNITIPLQPTKIPINQNGTNINFITDINQLKEYIAFSSSQFSLPISLGKIVNQNLHNTNNIKGIIITHSSLLLQAQRLAAFHLQQYGYTDAVVTIDKIYNEFSSGSPDPTAIRDYIKLLWDKASSTSTKPEYVLLFGAGSFDPKNRIPANINLVPVYESSNSLDPLLTFTSDDFFGLIDNADDINNNNSASPLSVAVGRLPVNNITEATIMVNKIINYHSAKSFGDWRKEMIFLADDQDNNLHLNDAESIVASAFSTNPIFHPQKLYLDAFSLVSGAGGARYPAVNEAIVNGIFNGALIFNYSGHGNFQRLTEEAVFSSAEVNRFNNPNKLPLFITASCDFAPHDNPTKQSLGEKLLHGNTNGGIALLTTTRLVFASSNRIMNSNYIQASLARKADGSYLSLGESVRIAKNNTIQNNGDVLNSRKFSLLGDPAMQLAFPKGLMRITEINNKPFTGNDSLQSLGKYNIKGEVLTPSGNINNSFTGIANIIIYDKAQSIKTLGNTVGSPVTNFSQQKNILFRGKATVTNGIFICIFVLPKDINFQIGNGSISLYAENGITDAASTISIKISAGNALVSADKTGPAIQLFLNDSLFKTGGLTNENPILIAKLFDSSGINATGNSIGHDITLVIDGDERNQIVLNDYYSNSIDNYQSGELRFQLPTITPGIHTLKVKAWDVLNNSNEARLEFAVAKKEKLQISAVRNFPNPFTLSTQFAFEHNQPNTNMLVDIQIFSSNGQKVRSIKRLLNTEGTRNVQISWKGDSDSGQKLAYGSYFYRIIVVADAQQTQSAGQLLLL